ncbi:protease inhibitor I42 family protein [Kitasatospora sp. GP82]|uniref:protease inhibitor I42 family protein n=1 Tax=Kitasatospora sp. GP82 TaxID=3035089 RepID=UPI002476D1B9|nr:protease inhibitor I42 family protein [Kitasatospora sp. GP82]MDH6126502.1 putative secreted protein [Kitasatospora sp. GP82]
MSEQSTAIRLRTGERYVVRLPGRGTAGYTWTSRVEGDSNALAVSVTTAPASEIAGRPIGASVDELAVLDALHPGRATVHLEQRRVWEQKPPLDHRVLDITVEHRPVGQHPSDTTPG